MSSLYEMAMAVDPDELKNYKPRLIWKNRRQFAFLMRAGDKVSLSVTGSIRVIFYRRRPDGWQPISKPIYNAWAKKETERRNQND